MKPFRLMAASALTLALAAPAAWAEKIPLNTLSSYLNGITTAQTKFTQIAGDGSVSTGTLYLKRPGKMRFEYDPPNKAYVIADHGVVGIFDEKGDESVEQYPLKRTPLNIILDETVDLGRANMVTGHREEGPSTIVKAQDPENPEYGYIELVFTANPTQLRQWVVHDDSGSATTVVLGDMQTGMSLSQRLFNFQDGFVADR
ncbi:LolA family protein [Pseudooceanicola nitratireducens]|uniref:LolA family protein n=1 Tax=Pseudooceanicola nitratireducens TaxID=517719 RepID=UPI0023EFAC7F|nr:outer membrane lipoprotein carrier protein LolA [Pseudooceanicola nitratireducens]MEC7793267.1 outer membrane lipoprotein carrier protein LolA [Pseudomonadota bacterium]MEE2817743.1 outer membrane lipoprotein carrier protein LolA [Pseudomonadota bacterium]